MTKLHQLQRDFQNYLLRNQQELILDQIREPVKGSAITRLLVYKNAYFYRLLEALEVDFPKCRTFLGAENFNALMHAYLNFYPSKYYSVNLVGERLAEFIKYHYLIEQKALLVELVEIEWLMLQLETAQNEKLLTLAELQTIPLENWAGLSLSLPTSLQAKRLDFNTMAIWAAIDAQQKIPQPGLISDRTLWIFWRRGFTIHYMSLNQQETLVFNALQQKNNFEQICSQLTELMSEEETVQYIVKLYLHWLQEGLFSGFQF